MTASNHNDNEDLDTKLPPSISTFLRLASTVVIGGAYFGSPVMGMFVSRPVLPRPRFLFLRSHAWQHYAPHILLSSPVDPLTLYLPPYIQQPLLPQPRSSRRPRSWTQLAWVLAVGPTKGKTSMAPRNWTATNPTSTSLPFLRRSMKRGWKKSSFYKGGTWAMPRSKLLLLLQEEKVAR